MQAPSGTNLIIKRNVWTTGLLIVVLATVMRALTTRGTWWFFDDLYFLQKSVGTDLSAGYLIAPYNGHLMPGAWALMWANAQIAPTDFELARWEMVIGFAVFAVGMLRLSIRLFDARWGALVPVIVALFSPIFIPATTWWAAAVNQIPMLIAIVFGLDAFVRYLRSPSTRLLLTHLMWFVMGVGFGERAIVAFGFAWMLALSYFTSGSLSARVRDLSTRYRTATLIHLGFVATYVAVYLSVAANFAVTQAASRPLWDVARNLMWQAFTPAVIGGPLHFTTSKVTQQTADPTTTFTVIAALALASTVWVAHRTRSHSKRAWLLPLGSLALNTLLIAASRAIYFGPEIALDYRFQTEAGLAWSLAVGLAYLPVLGATEQVSITEPMPSLVTPRSVALVLIVTSFLGSLSALRFPLRDLGSQSPRAYLGEVAKASSDTTLINLTVPPWIWSPFAFPTNTYRHVFKPFNIAFKYGPPVEVPATLIADDGTLRTAPFHGVRNMVTATPGACVPVGTNTTPFVLDGPVVGYGWYLQLDYAAQQSGTMKVIAGTKTTSVDVIPGQHTVMVETAGGYETVSVVSSEEVLDITKPPLCVSRTEVGSLTEP